MSGLGLRHEEREVDDLSSMDLLVAPVVKIVIPRAAHGPLLRFLWTANVTAASLFPDLDGFARSLRTMFRIRDAGGIADSADTEEK